MLDLLNQCGFPKELIKSSAINVGLQIITEVKWGFYGVLKGIEVSATLKKHRVKLIFCLHSLYL